MSFVRLLRIAVSTALIALSSGAPYVVLAALDDDCCSGPCDGDDGGCPPNCTQGACARTISTAAVAGACTQVPRMGSMEQAPVAILAPALPLVTRGVFHPPQR